MQLRGLKIGKVNSINCQKMLVISEYQLNSIKSELSDKKGIIRIDDTDYRLNGVFRKAYHDISTCNYYFLPVKKA